MSSLDFTYDAEADAAYVYVMPKDASRVVATTRFCNIELDAASIMVDFNADGKIVGFEILGANQLIPPEALGESES